MITRLNIRLLLILILLCLAPPLYGQANETQLQARVDQLIQQLGSDSYRDRESAEAELKGLGLLAFEPLQAVRSHPDIEIRLRARAMVSQLRKLFLTDGIDPVLGRFVENYETFSEERREVVARHIASFLPQQGLEVLSRIARFEDSELIAKQAALSILEAAIKVPDEERAAWLEEVNEAAAISRRTSTVWLRCFSVAMKEDGPTLAAQWENLLAEEEALLATASHQTSSDVVLRLKRLHTDLLQFAAIENNLRAEFVSTPQDGEQTAQDWLLWLQDRKEWPSIVAMHGANKALFAGDRLLLYGLAEAHEKLGNADLALTTADRAFDLGSPSKGEQDEEERRQMANYLEDERGQFEWAEREYRAAFEAHGGNDQLDEVLGAATYGRYRALFPLAEMLHDQLRDLDAAKVLQRIHDDVENDQTLLSFFPQLGRDYDSTMSRMHFFYADHYRRTGDHEKQREHLELGFEADPTDADLLIAMYRFEGADEAWNRKVERAISDASASFRSQIRDASIDRGRQTVSTGALLASALNQFAWLVGNTIGDGHEALRHSQRSLELNPGNPGYLDTLARCYFNVGDLDQAIRYQTWAVRRSPHEGQLIRQLEFFEQEQAAKN